MSTRLAEVATVYGEITDADVGRMLHEWSAHFEDRPAPDTLLLRDRATGVDTRIFVAINEHGLHESYLTPVGAMFVANAPDAQEHVFEWRAGQLSDLGVGHRLVVKGDFAVWAGSGGFVLRDIPAGTNTTVATSLSGNFDLAPNGDIVFDTGWQIFRSRSGVTSQLTDTTARYSSPVTDGVDVLYRGFSLSGQDTWVVIHTDTGQVVLSRRRLGNEPGSSGPIRPLEPESLHSSVSGGARPHPLQPPFVLAREGWFAWIDYNDVPTQPILTRSPTGQVKQATFFGTTSSIDALGPDGSLVVTVDGVGGRYLATSPYGAPPEQIGSIGRLAGRALWIDGAWFVAIGRSLFEVN